MKTCRLNVNVVQEIVNETNIRFIYLIRDPRGIMASRKKAKFCTLPNFCYDSTELCKDQLENYKSMQVLSKNYPEKFM